MKGTGASPVWLCGCSGGTGASPRDRLSQRSSTTRRLLENGCKTLDLLAEERGTQAEEPEELLGEHPEVLLLGCRGDDDDARGSGCTTATATSKGKTHPDTKHSLHFTSASLKEIYYLFLF